MLYHSSWDYTYLKAWLNKIAPLIVKLKGGPEVWKVVSEERCLIEQCG
ncbi:MAG: hypothetical protein ACYST6_04525 [Planctomycetota bacterium]